MTRKLIDYKKLNHTLAALLIESYPYGYGDDDILTFKNADGEIIEAVEIRTADTIYMVKISKSLSSFISNFEETINKELEAKSEAIPEEVDIQEIEDSSNFENEAEKDSDWPN